MKQQGCCGPPTEGFRRATRDITLVQPCPSKGVFIVEKHAMHIKHFTTYIQYEAVKPSYVSSNRWHGMLRWYVTRLAEGYTPQDMYFGWQYVHYLV